jgi:ech hydrogenase subunit A
VGTPETMWAGVFLMIFHAISKSLLFQDVGATENSLHSRDVEDMHGLLYIMPKLAAFMFIGIAGMFLAPFGMLISKWGCMVSFVDSGNILLIGCICFGSAVTAFYWLKWMGKLTAVVAGEESIETGVHKTESAVHFILVALVILVCLIFPLISSYMLVPYLEVVFGGLSGGIMSSGNMTIMVIMIAVLVLLAAMFFGKSNKKQVPIYLAGVNAGDNRTYHGSMQTDVQFTLRNWYMDKFFNERRMNIIGDVAAVVMLVIGIGYMIGTLISVFGGVA